MSYFVSPPPGVAQIQAQQARERDEHFVRSLRQRVENGLRQAQQEQDAVLAISFWHPCAGQLSVFALAFDAPDLVSIHGVDAANQE
jgi:hypothetical protein